MMHLTLLRKFPADRVESCTTPSTRKATATRYGVRPYRVAPAIADRGGFSELQRKKSGGAVKLCAHEKICF